MESAWRAGDGVAGRMAGALPPDHQPQEMPTLMEPRLVELCFQAAGVGELGNRGKMGLPLHIDRVSTLRRPNGGALTAVTRPRAGEGAAEAYGVGQEGKHYRT